MVEESYFKRLVLEELINIPYEITVSNKQIGEKIKKEINMEKSYQAIKIAKKILIIIMIRAIE